MSFIQQYHKHIATFAGFSFVGIVVTLVLSLLTFIYNDSVLWHLYSEYGIGSRPVMAA